MASAHSPSTRPSYDDNDAGTRLEQLDQLEDDKIREMARDMGIHVGRSKKITLINKIMKKEDELQHATDPIPPNDDEGENNSGRTEESSTQQLLERLVLALENRQQWEQTRKMEMTKLKDGEDVENWLRVFEKVATVNGWPKEMWGYKIGPLLVGTTLTVYNKLSLAELSHYQHVKRQLLHASKLSPDVFCSRYHSLKLEEYESYLDYGRKKIELCERWIETSGKSWLDVIVMYDQFQQWMKTSKDVDLVTYIQASKPRTSLEMYELADQFKAMRATYDQTSRETKFARNRNKQQQNKGKSIEKDSSNAVNKKRIYKCYVCGSVEHMASRCPKRFDVTSEQHGRKGGKISNNANICAHEDQKPNSKYLKKGRIGERSVSILLDTGADLSIAKRSLLTQEVVRDSDTVQITSCLNQVQTVPTAQVTIQIGKIKRSIRVAVLNDPPHDVMLGQSAIDSFGLIAVKETEEGDFTEPGKEKCEPEGMACFVSHLALMAQMDEVESDETKIRKDTMRSIEN
ncbi:hypothetical protein TrispH2_012051 [Trichoplax sp. H2]|nr:hypothetical protein TrispH2_012051 [Trichoplax sp. H2]|eukprot:RDD35995.1 hypothetical protein TrispH2_012051 [Trichoplax sp. H2]